MPRSLPPGTLSTRRTGAGGLPVRRALPGGVGGYNPGWTPVLPDRRSVCAVTTEPVAIPSSLAELRATTARRRDAARWLQPLPPIVMAVVVWAACTTEPRPGLAGRHLAVAIALAAFV